MIFKVFVAFCNHVGAIFYAKIMKQFSWIWISPCNLILSTAAITHIWRDCRLDDYYIRNIFFGMKWTNAVKFYLSMIFNFLIKIFNNYVEHPRNIFIEDLLKFKWNLWK